MSIALLFPGQGSQHDGFLNALPDHAAVRETMIEASDLLGLDVLTLDTEAALDSTVTTQLTLVIAGTAFARFCAAAQIKPAAVAGISVGSYAAAITAESIDLSTALTLVRRRAELMEATFPAGSHGMAVVDGLRVPTLRSLLQETPLTIANYNSESQHVVAGDLKALHLFLQRAAEAGAHTAKLLRMSVASHTSVLLAAAHQLSELATQMPVHKPRIPLYSNRDARPLLTAEAVRDELVFNMAYPVRWHDIVTALGGIDITLFLEAPPGHTLTHLASHILPEIPSLAAEKTRWDVILRSARRSL